LVESDDGTDGQEEETESRAHHRIHRRLVSVLQEDGLPEAAALQAGVALRASRCRVET